MKYGLNCNGEIEIRTEIPQKPKYKSEEIWILEANGINSKLKYRKAHNSILSGRFGDPYGRPGAGRVGRVCAWQALACYRLLDSGESESNKIWWLGRDGTHFFAACPLSRLSPAPTRFRALLFSIRSSLSVSHKTGYATRQDEQNPLFWLVAPRDWDWIRKRICKTILVNSGLPFAHDYACAFKSAVLLKRTANQFQGLLSNPFSDFPKTTRKERESKNRYLSVEIRSLKSIANPKSGF